MQACEAFEAVRQSAESIKNSDTQNFPEAASAGDTFRQGDLYIEKLSSVPRGAEKIDVELQLAPGTTQGSRHILDSPDGVQMFRLKNPSALDGPIFKIDQTRTVTHPEHGNVVCPPGCYGVTYQRMHAEEIRRQMD